MMAATARSIGPFYRGLSQEYYVSDTASMGLLGTAQNAPSISEEGSARESKKRRRDCEDEDKTRRLRGVARSFNQ